MRNDGFVSDKGTVHANDVKKWSGGCFQRTLSKKGRQVQLQEVSESIRCLACNDKPESALYFRRNLEGKVAIILNLNLLV